MSEIVEKFLDQITEDEWVKYQWFDTTDLNCTQRRFIRGVERSPSEAHTARVEWQALKEKR